MNDNLDEHDAVRKYLLGSLKDNVKMRQIEENLLLDDDFSEHLSIAEDELIDEYLGGNLSDDEQEQFVRFFLVLPERKQKVRLIKNLQKYAAKTKTQKAKDVFREKTNWFDWRRLLPSPALRFTTAALLLFVVGFSVWRIFIYQSDADKGLAQLRLAYSGQRPFEARTTAGFDYANLSVTRGDDKTTNEEDALKRAERFLLDAKDNSADSKAHHAFGLFYLVEKQFDKAIAEFELALKNDSSNARLHNDLGVAFLEKAGQFKFAEQMELRAESLARSLEHFNKAVELNNKLPEPLFNKALSLQKMNLYQQAKEAWHKYLALDPDSPWAEEAKRNLDELEKSNSLTKSPPQVLQDFLDAYRARDDRRAWEILSQTREMVTGTMIPMQLARQVTNAESRKNNVKEILSAFLYAGELEERSAGDPYVRELAEYYSTINEEQLQKLAAAQTAMSEGNQLLIKVKNKDALQSFLAARKLFGNAGNVWEAKVAEIQICYSLAKLDRIKESNRQLESLAQFSEERNYKWLQSQAYGWLGSNYDLLSEYSKAINYDQKALSIAEQISDIYNSQKMLSQIANEYKLIGNPGKGLGYLYRSLTIPISYYLSLRQRWRNVAFTTESLYSLKYYSAAAAFALEELHLAETEYKDASIRHTAHIHLGMIYGQMQNHKEAVRHIESSRQIAQSLQDEKVKNRLSSDSLLALAHLQRQSGECAGAVDNYSRAIEAYEGMDFSVDVYDARKGRLLCYLMQENETAVAEELQPILKLFDEHRASILEEQNRNSFFDAEQSVYDIAIDYSYSKSKDVDRAFDLAESSRARSLLDSIQAKSSIAKTGTDFDVSFTGATQPLALAEIRSRMPENAQLIQYTALPNKVLIWVISKDKYFTAETNVNYDELKTKILRYVQLTIEQPANVEESRRLATELHQILIQPAAAILDSDKSLCLIADKVLFRLPFAALISPETSRYLIEDYNLLLAPSATVFTLQTELAKQKIINDRESLLSVGNPAFSQKEYLKLADLPDATREAKEITSLYQTLGVFTERDASKENIESNLAVVNVFHFAGHYLPNIRSPLQSKFLLAAKNTGEATENDDLYVHEIARRQLPNARLMILSACNSGIERHYNGEGMIGAARAFLASGVPLVVASQWAVESKATAELMIKFHRYRKLQGLSTTSALRRAQIDLLSDSESRFRQPYYWAGFMTIGGYADF